MFKYNSWSPSWKTNWVLSAVSVKSILQSQSSPVSVGDIFLCYHGYPKSEIAANPIVPPFHHTYIPHKSFKILPLCTCLLALTPNCFLLVLGGHGLRESSLEVLKSANKQMWGWKQFGGLKQANKRKQMRWAQWGNLWTVDTWNHRNRVSR